MELVHPLHLNRLSHPGGIYGIHLQNGYHYPDINVNCKTNLQTESSSNTNNNFLSRIIYGYEKRRDADVDVKCRVNYFNVFRFHLLHECFVITSATVVLDYRGGIAVAGGTKARKAGAPVEREVNQQICARLKQNGELVKLPLIVYLKFVQRRQTADEGLFITYMGQP